jgi:hypothetical protein
MIKLAAVVGLAVVASLLLATGIEPSQLIGKWSGRIERPGMDEGRRMAQVGTAEFSTDHKFGCHFEDPERQPLYEEGTWKLKDGRLSITTERANGKKIKPQQRAVEISQTPLEMRLPVKSGAWFLVLRPEATPR